MRWLLLPILALAGVALALAARPAPPAPAAVQASASPPAGYPLELSFAEEFGGAALDRERWTTALAPRSLAAPGLPKRTLYTNGELQVYLDPDYLALGLNPFAVAGGTLTIRAAPLSARVLAAVHADADREVEADRRALLRRIRYGSGLISTRDRFVQRYGYFEVRARWSGGKGLWPCFWLLPEDGGWPPEIDVVEAHGDKPTTIFQSVHSSIDPTAVTREAAVDRPDVFHRYGVLWLPDRLDYYIDGVKTATIPAPTDMTKRMYLVANLAVGGSWPGEPDAATRFPATLEIDYIRAWRLGSSPDAAR